MFGNDPRCRRLCLARCRHAPMNKSSLMNAKVALRLWLDFGVLVECFGFERIYFEFHLSNLCSNTFTFFAVYFLLRRVSRVQHGNVLLVTEVHTVQACVCCDVTPVQQLDSFSQTFHSKMSGSWVSQRILLTGWRACVPLTEHLQLLFWKIKPIKQPVD